MKKLLYLLLPLILLGFCSCEQNDLDSNFSDDNVANKILDGANKGNKNFYFLPPMVSSPTFSGVFTPSLNPKVKIYALDGSDIIEPAIAVFDSSNGLTTDLIEEHYKVNWNTNDYNLDDQITYRIQILVDAVVLGYADVDLVSGGNELKNVDTGEYIALKDGRTLPISFRIEEGAVINALLMEGLIAYYPFNGNANDESYNEYNGTVNGAMLTPDRYGNLNSAYSFNGTDNYIVAPVDMSTLFNPGNPITFSLWMNSGFTTLIYYDFILGGVPGGGPDFFASIKEGDQGKIRVRLYGGTHGVSDSSVLDGNWHHIAWGVDSSGIAFFYVDGVIQSSLPSIGLFTRETELVFGGRLDGALPFKDFYTGTIDDIRIYNRALSSGEIMTLFNN